jgi:hypothetical protein
MPPGLRKSGIPLAVLMPAPERMLIDRISPFRIDAASELIEEALELMGLSLTCNLGLNRIVRTV